MSTIQLDMKITEEHRRRKAIVYLRQSSLKQVTENLESQRLQYAMKDRARALGFEHVETIDCDLGCSASLGAADRKGFDYVISAVARSEVGIVLSREVSRLSRTDKDWCHLLEVCQIFGTLIGDEQQIYDLSLLDDQLVLGIKGTLSVVELKVIRMRLLRGQEEKARRGELFKRLPSGYVLDSEEKVTKSPDKRVQEAIALIFTTFQQRWSVRQTFQWFRDNDILLPVNAEHGSNTLVWRAPTQGFIRDILINPFYAGAYTWGRRPTETVLVEGRLKKRQVSLRRPDECKVFIPKHHEGYIDWETYEENLKRIRGNAVKWQSNELTSAIRSGQGLLTGLLRCGHCGRKLHVRYWGGTGTQARYLCKGDFDSGGNYCLGFGGTQIDRHIGRQILKVISPLGIEASLHAIAMLSSREDGRQNALKSQLEQLQYEARRAFEQYNAVDARNRLVAAELERRWNTKLEEIEKITAAISELEQQAPKLDVNDHQKIIVMGKNFEDVWNNEHCPGELKKKIARTIIEEIIASDVHNTIRLIIHWKGGVHTELIVNRPMPATAQKTSMEALEIIRRMAVRYGDDQIASVLNRSGHRTGKNLRWNQIRVKTARRNHSIPGQAHTVLDPNILTLTQAAKYCRVSNRTIQRLVEAGKLKMQQVAPRAPWEISRPDLDCEPVVTIIKHLRRTGKLVLERDNSIQQLSLPIEIKGDDNARHYE